MKNYDRINALPPKGIERKKAHIVGGGIAGLASAAFLVLEAHMPGENITIYEAEAVNGGCLDAHWDPKVAAFRNRGSRMFERRYECLSYLMEKIPSTQTPGRTLLDETHQANEDFDLHAYNRAMVVVLRAESIDWAKPPEWAIPRTSAPTSPVARGTRLESDRVAAAA